MTLREELTARGFFFMVFTTPEARAAHTLHNCPEEFECETFEEVHLAKEFKLFFLGYKKLHHTPVRFTPPLGAA